MPQQGPQYAPPQDRISAYGRPMPNPGGYQQPQRTPMMQRRQMMMRRQAQQPGASMQGISGVEGGSSNAQALTANLQANNGAQAAYQNQMQRGQMMQRPQPQPQASSSMQGFGSAGSGSMYSNADALAANQGLHENAMSAASYQDQMKRRQQQPVSQQPAMSGIGAGASNNSNAQVLTAQPSDRNQYSSMMAQRRQQQTF